MKTAARGGANTALLASLGLMCGFSSNPSQPRVHEIGVDVIFTAAPAYHPLAALSGEERFPQGAQLTILHAGKAEPLVAGFAATADADLSLDAKTVLFAGKRKADGPWEIWEIRLADRELRRVIAGAGDVIRPLYLPGGKLVYARRMPQGFEIESAMLDGSDPLQLTYLNASALPAQVLRDGRILFEANYPLSSGSTPEMFLVYQDGSGVESYRCDHGMARWGGRQLSSGDVVFTHGATLARFTSPLAHEAAINAPKAEYSGGVAEAADGEWLMSVRAAGAAHLSLRLMKPAGAGAGAASLFPYYAQSDSDLVEPIVVAPRTRPNIHPSALHPWSYANLLALDARQSREGALKQAPATVRLETLAADGRAVSMGTAPVEADGSFFVQAPADQPIRFALLDDKGATLRQEQGWFWIRRGEQRYCVGCHTGPERAPENHAPAVLLRTTTAVNLTGAGSSAATATAGGK